MKRIIATFGGTLDRPTVAVRGPHNRSSNKWALDMGYSSLALYWQHDRGRAIVELQALRDALDFIESNVLVGEEVAS